MSTHHKSDTAIIVPPFNPFAGVNLSDPIDWIYVIMTILHPFVIIPLFIAGIVPGVLWCVIRDGMTPKATTEYKDNRRRLGIQHRGGKLGPNMVPDYRYEDVLRDRASGVRRPIDNYYH